MSFTGALNGPLYHAITVLLFFWSIYTELYLNPLLKVIYESMLLWLSRFQFVSFFFLLPCCKFLAINVSAPFLCLCSEGSLFLHCFFLHKKLHLYENCYFNVVRFVNNVFNYLFWYLCYWVGVFFTCFLALSCVCAFCVFAALSLSMLVFSFL